MSTNIRLRPSPSISATLFKVGTVKKGNDGNMWTVYKARTGVKRWKKHVSSKSEVHIKVKNGIITEFQLSSIKSFKKEGMLKIESKVAVGEFSIQPPNGFSKFGKGTYHIYKIDDNLVLSKKLMTKQQALKSMWKHTDINFGVDGGLFGFWDQKMIKELASILSKQFEKSRKRSDKFFSYRIPTFYDIGSGNRTVFLKVKNFDESTKFVGAGADPNKIVGVVRSTGTGDGYFDCYTSGSALMLLGGSTSIKLFDIVERTGTSTRSTSIKTSRKKSRSKSRKGTKRKSSKRK